MNGENSGQWSVKTKGGSWRRSKSTRSKPTGAEGQRSKTAGCLDHRDQGVARSARRGEGNRSSALCLSGRERISIVLLSFGGASWMVSGSVRGGVDARHPGRGR